MDSDGLKQKKILFCPHEIGGQMQLMVEAAIERMMTLMTWRGPDNMGIWRDPAGHLWWGFCRLAILDLTPTGHQPMVFADGRPVIVFNDEIHNFPYIPLAR